MQDNKDFLPLVVISFFNNPSKGKPLTLDQMPGMLNRLVHSNHTIDELVKVEVQEELLQRIQTRAPQLLGQPKPVRESRKRALEWIKATRNKCDHAEKPKPEEEKTAAETEKSLAEAVEEMLEYVLLGRPSEEVFFRYFVGAFARASGPLS